MSVRITEQASIALKEILDNTQHDLDQVFRLVSDSQGDGLALGKQRIGDIVLRNEGATILVIEPSVYRALSGLTLDVRLTPDGYSWSLL